MSATTTVQMLTALLLSLPTWITAGCTITQVRLKQQAGYESRDLAGRPRASYQVGVEAQETGGVSVGVKYRYRISDFSGDHQEHGCFVDLAVPLYKKL